MSNVIVDLETWIDTVVTLGLRSLSPAIVEQAHRLVVRLDQAGLRSAADSLAEVLRSETPNPEAALGRLLVVFELTREADDLDRLSRPMVIAKPARS
jgi:hypothetical protein